MRGIVSRGVSTLSLAAAISLSAGTAYGQTSAESETPPPPNTTGQADVTTESGTEAAIVVTGSRIVRDGYTAPTPVTVVSTEQLAAVAPSNIAEGLQQLPQFAGGRSPSTVSGVGNFPSGGSYLSLRSLGIRRTLLLFDGVRLPPTDAQGNTDANIIPQALVSRVDVVTGGASAAYGSDAVAGVTNFVLDTTFTGLKGRAQYGVSDYGDGDSYRFDIAGGFDVPGVDGLHVLFSYNHFQQEGIRDTLDNRQAGRPFGDLGLVRLGTGREDNPYYTAPNGRYPDGTWGSVVVNRTLPNGQPHPLNGYHFIENGQLAEFDRGNQVGSFSSGGDGGESFGKSIIGETNNEQLFGRLDYEFSGNLSAFVQGSYSDLYAQHVTIASGTSTGRAHRIYADNAFLPQEAVDLFNSIDPSVPESERYAFVGRIHADQPPKEARFQTEAWNVIAGLRGSIGAFDWRLNYSHGDSLIKAEHDGNFDHTRYYAGIDAVRHPETGNIVCRVTITNPGVLDDCVPFNMFGNGSPSVAAYEYVSLTSKYDIRNKLDVISGEIAGDAFDLPAGPVSFAVGGEWRKQSLLQRSNTDPSTPLDVPFLRAVPAGRSLLQFSSTNVGSAVGDVTVKEAFGEIAVPVFDSSLGTFDLNGAARYTDYSTSGGVTTWKVGGTYTISDVRLRATLSRDIRAPSLFELFSGPTANRAPFTDIHILGPDGTPGLPGNVIYFNRGNPDLDPERATTFTVGVGWQPSFIPGFTASVDYFRIKLKDAIGGIGVGQIVDECEESNGTGPTCQFIDRPFPFENRDPENYPSSISTVPFNLALQKVEGIDYEFAYRTDLGAGLSGDGAQVSLRLIGTHLISDESQSNEGATVQQSNNSGANTKNRANLILNYEDGPVRLNTQARYIGPRKRTQSPTVFYRDDENNIPSRTYVDTTIAYGFTLADVDMEAYLTVNNLFDRTFPVFAPGCQPTQCLPTDSGIYDVVGRFYSFGLRFDF